MSRAQTQMVMLGPDNVLHLRRVLSEDGEHADRIQRRLDSRAHLPSGQEARRALCLEEGSEAVATDVVMAGSTPEARRATRARRSAAGWA